MWVFSSHGMLTGYVLNQTNAWSQHLWKLVTGARQISKEVQTQWLFPHWMWLKIIKNLEYEERITVPVVHLMNSFLREINLFNLFIYCSTFLSILSLVACQPCGYFAEGIKTDIWVGRERELSITTFSFRIFLFLWYISLQEHSQGENNIRATENM